MNESLIAKKIGMYADGEISRLDLQNESGLSFFDILERLTALNLKLPKVDTNPKYNDKQKLIYDEFFGIKKNE